MKKAKDLREKTGNPKIFALHEQDREAPGRLWKVTLTRCVLLRWILRGVLTFAS
mgnify:CR=1 FL=1